MALFGNTIRTLETSLNYASAKNQTIANNISNVDTPNYKAKNVVFKDVLNNNIHSLEMKTSDKKHITNSKVGNRLPYELIIQKNTQYNHNGNNVDIDKEMTELAKNQIYYNSLIDRINGKFSSLKTVIRGGN